MRRHIFQHRSSEVGQNFLVASESARASARRSLIQGQVDEGLRRSIVIGHVRKQCYPWNSSSLKHPESTPGPAFADSDAKMVNPLASW